MGNVRATTGEGAGECMPANHLECRLSVRPEKLPQIVYWHRELPPAHSEVMHEHVIEAVSDRIPGAIERHGELWQRCYDELMEHTRFRIEQEVKRLGGDYAHVLDEHIDSRATTRRAKAGCMAALITFSIGRPGRRTTRHRLNGPRRPKTIVIASEEIPSHSMILGIRDARQCDLTFRISVA